MKTLVFAPETHNIAETTRMIEVARACHGKFDAVFLGYGGGYEHLIEEFLSAELERRGILP